MATLPAFGLNAGYRLNSRTRSGRLTHTTTTACGIHPRPRLCCHHLVTSAAASLRVRRSLLRARQSGTFRRTTDALGHASWRPATARPSPNTGLRATRGSQDFIFKTFHTIHEWSFRRAPADRFDVSLACSTRPECMALTVRFGELAMLRGSYVQPVRAVLADPPLIMRSADRRAVSVAARRHRRGVNQRAEEYNIKADVGRSILPTDTGASVDRRPDSDPEAAMRSTPPRLVHLHAPYHSGHTRAPEVLRTRDCYSIPTMRSASRKRAAWTPTITDHDHIDGCLSF